MTPTVEVVVRLAEIFDVSIDYLLLEGAPRRRFGGPGDEFTKRLSMAGGCFLFAPGARRTSESPTRTALRNSRRSAAVSSPGAAARPRASASPSRPPRSPRWPSR